MVDWVTNWRRRHQHPVSRALHGVGIPIVVVALILVAWQLAWWRWDLWWRPAALVATGYTLQWIGHRIEGNDMGEAVLIKKLLGRPYVAISPRYDQTKGSPAK